MVPVGPSDADEPDARLMERCAAGDLEAFGALVERYHERAIAFAYRLAGDHETARDATQDAFLLLLRSASRYDHRGIFRHYLFEIVRNAVRGILRSRRRRREDPIDSVPEATKRPGTAAVTAPDRAAATRELQAKLVAALQALPEEMRAVFILSEIDGCSYEEIARICRCPAGTVASRKNAAVRKLRELLEDEQTP